MKKKNKFLSELTPILVALICFVAIVLIYCSPILSGKVINQPDMLNFKGMSKEVFDFREQTGEEPYWTNSMFSGMPAYQISALAPSVHLLDFPSNLYHLFFSGVLASLLGYFIGFYILMRSFGVNKWLSIIGSIAISFSSYFFIILAAGHNSKALTIGYFAPVIGGFYLIFRKKKYLIGIPLVLICTAIGALLHPQMTYYFCMMLGVFFIAELVVHIQNKKVKDFLFATLIFAGSFAIGIGTGYGKYKANQEYLTETMRGGHSEIIKDDELKDNSSGLNLEYATQWSYGIPETFTLMIPNFNGGSSHYTISSNSKIYKELISKGMPANTAAQFCSSLPMYWGTQPFTSGPVYVGAIICFLFVLGLFIVKGPYKWALGLSTLFSILLAWGHNFMGFTKLFFKYFPMYDKFRAVSSILVVAEVAMPLLGFLAIKTIMDKKIEKKDLQKKIFISGGITAGICLFFAIFGKVIFSFTSPQDAGIFAQLPDWLTSSIVSERASMLVSDSLRSALFIALAVAVFVLYIKDKLKFAYFTIILGGLILIDMWGVNKRFFNNDNFVTQREYDSYFAKLPYEEQILADPDLYFRVINLTTNTFNDSRTSYYLNSVGGYHGAKLRRYQDLIDQHLSKGNMNVLNMLNTKYFITRGNNNMPVHQLNTSALGNCWFIDSLAVVNTPIEESNALNTINPAYAAVTDVKFKDFAKNFNATPDSTALIKLTSYAPNKLEYVSTSNLDKTAVFSDIYYPYGWQAFIDDKPVDHFRVNYVLRALNIPAGDHKIVFKFHPTTLYKADKVSYALIILMYVITAGCIGFGIYKATNKNKDKNNNIVEQ